MEITRTFVRALNQLEKNKASILSGMAVAGVLGTVALAVKAKPKADRLLAEQTFYVGLHYNRKLTRFEKFITVAPTYTPTTLMFLGTAACIIGADKIHKDKEAMLASAYIYMNRMYNDYREAVKHIHGPEADRMVKEYLAPKPSNDIIHAPVENPENITVYDEYGKRYFTTTKTKFKEALYDINKIYNFTGEMTLNDFYEFFDLEPVPGGNLLGWAALKDYECTGTSWIDVKLEPMETVDFESYVMIFNINPADDFGCWTMPD